MASATVRRAPYKDTLQPALHKRFSSTATLLLAVAYLEALVLASWSSRTSNDDVLLFQFGFVLTI